MSVEHAVDYRVAAGKEALQVVINALKNAERGDQVVVEDVRLKVQSAVSGLEMVSTGNLSALQPQDGYKPSGWTTVNSVSSYSTMQPISVSKITELDKRKAAGLIDELRLQESRLMNCCIRKERERRLAAQTSELRGTAGQPYHGMAEFELQEKEKESLRNIKRRFNHIETQSDEVLQVLKGQGRTLGRTTGTLGTMKDSLDGANHLIQSIIRRMRTDMAIVFLGVFLLVLLMVYLWRR